ncbi:MAG TPA: hypothetical protein VLN57_20860 [Xanthobacteraceae bacterium]|nr:hypothetical protein [Xanthobacteraceae bacterium]
MADPTNADILAAIHAGNAALADVRATLNFVTAKVLLMANVLDPVVAQLTALQTAVANETTIDQSAITLLNGLGGQIAALAAQLATAIANQADPATVSALVTQLTTLGTTVTASSTALAAAVTANTPAAP